MWRKALVLGLVLMAIGVVVGGAVEASYIGFKLYTRHFKWGEDPSRDAAVTLGIGFVATKTFEVTSARTAAKIGARIGGRIGTAVGGGLGTIIGAIAGMAIGY